MIDFRYYIVSITAIFLALGIGVVTGATVLDRVTADALRNRLDGLREDFDKQRANIRTLRAERDRSNDLVDALAPRVTTDALAGIQVVFVRSDANPSWERGVRDVLKRAGAEDTGTLVLTRKWELTNDADRDQLREAFGTLDGDDIGDRALRDLGRSLTDGTTLLQRLTDQDFLEQSPTDESTPFPPPTAHIVVLGTANDVWLAAFARGASDRMPTLAVARAPDDLGPVGELRGQRNLPDDLATFDSAADDPGGIGTVLALRAAADKHGGHFGSAPGVRYLPTPS